jgi:soluble lytic murein transglycosylase-like protein
VSEAIDKYTTRYNIEPHIYTSILMQESGYDLAAANDKSKDYGISQINIRTIKAFGFDKKRLLTDLDYSIKAGAIVLSDFKRMYHKKEGDKYWSRYNTSKPSLRLVYKRKVARHFLKKGEFYATTRD